MKVEKTIDVTALGELLIDFTENGMSPQGNPLMEANPGGAPCNVLAILTGLGRKTAFIGKVGDDMFGNQLADTLVEVGISTAGLVKDKKVHTTLAFVHTFPDGDRDFSCYRNPGADVMLTKDEVNEELIRASRVFHFGSLSMTHTDCCEATKAALEIARDAGCIITFDPNLREPLWETLDDAKEAIAYGMSCCDVMKISDNEIIWFTGIEDFDAGIAKLFEMYPNIKLILLSMGRDGSSAYMDGIKVTVPPFLQENTIETTGAGDTFCGSVINGILNYGLDNLDEEKLRGILTFANAGASLITTRKGALRVMPGREEIEELVKSRA